MSERIPAEVFPPGEFVKEELEARGWTQADLAEILGRPPRLINEIINGKRAISPETAKGLGEAFGTGAQFWMNLESAYQLARVKEPDDAVARKAHLYSKVPVKEMVKRGWIESSHSVDVFEKQILDFFELTHLDEEIRFCAAARQSASYMAVTPMQCAWLFRAKKLARAVQVNRFTPQLLNTYLEELRGLLESLEEVRHVPRILAESGIRFVVLEPLPQTRIDGVCFWLNDISSVIALSLRYDRLDWFWFTYATNCNTSKMAMGAKDQPNWIWIWLVNRHYGQRRSQNQSSKQIVSPPNFLFQKANWRILLRVCGPYIRSKELSGSPHDSKFTQASWSDSSNVATRSSTPIAAICCSRSENR
jgi:HTH-type transcriptional regulator/antitoxin HigA